ncbi:AAA domain family protein [Mycobacterium xenopi 4042]|uniref:AAA domain family protein n=1 Tax=Mycobacterium xenopi 4042 TaxID=1299334 RepID=X8BKA8_MYCXE|nr:AAA domain family protein [Mycobacterium xenopi 4042]
MVNLRPCPTVSSTCPVRPASPTATRCFGRGTAGRTDAPATIGELVGQDHLLRPGSPLRRLIEGSGVASVILYGPPGSGKTTLAALISRATGRRFEALSALSAGSRRSAR